MQLRSTISFKGLEPLIIVVYMLSTYDMLFSFIIQKCMKLPLNLQSNLDKIVHKLKKLYAYGTDHPTVANTDKGHHKLNLFIMIIQKCMKLYF